MNASKLIERREKAKGLPLGHYDRTKAKLAVDAEYRLCREIEQPWRKRLRFDFEEAKQALDFCNRLAAELGEKPVSKVILESPDVQAGALAHYNWKKGIHCRCNWIGWVTLVHEFTHHCGAYGHDEKFCELERFIFPIAYTLLTGKKCKPDW